MNMAQRLAYMRRGLSVARYHQYTTTGVDNVGKHSAGLALFLVLMNDTLPRSELLVAALAHDLPEGEMGDVPSPAKKAWPESAKIALEIEETRLNTEAGLNHWLTSDEQRQLKLADCYDGLMFCIEERRRGNCEIKVVGDKYLQYISELPRSPNIRESELRNILEKWWKQANEQR